MNAHYNYDDELLEMWKNLSKGYRELIPTYNRLIDKKRELKLRLDQLTLTTLRELPEISFLKCETLEDAKDYLKNVRDNYENPDRHFIRLRLQLQSLPNNYSFRVINDRIKMYERQIRNRHKPRTYVRRIVTKS